MHLLLWYNMTIACLKLLCLVIQVGLPIQLLLFTHIVHLHRAEIMLLCTQAFFDWFHALDFCFLEMYPKLEDLVHCAFCNGEAMVDELWFALWVITITIKMLLYKLLYTNVHKCRSSCRTSFKIMAYIYLKVLHCSKSNRNRVT